MSFEGDELSQIAAAGYTSPRLTPVDAVIKCTCLTKTTDNVDFTKNAIDWLSRPPNDIPRVFRGRAVAIAGASPGGFGTILSQNAWLPVFRTLGADLWSGGRLLVSRAGSLVDPGGEVSDAPTREAIGKFVKGFVDYVGSRKGG